MSVDWLWRASDGVDAFNWMRMGIFNRGTEELDHFSTNRQGTESFRKMRLDTGATYHKR